MLVEDDNNLREIYEARLLAEGYEIVSAHDGEEALALAVREKPDLIISDVMMPKISGFDMLDILRTTPETKNTKVIMMTALSQAEDKDRADKLGADKYLVKSQVTLEDVARVAREVLEGGDATAQQTDTTTTQPAVATTPEPAAPVVPVVASPVAEPPTEPPVQPPVVASPVVEPPLTDDSKVAAQPEPAALATPPIEPPVQEIAGPVPASETTTVDAVPAPEPVVPTSTVAEAEPVAPTSTVSEPEPAFVSAPVETTEPTPEPVVPTSTIEEPATVATPVDSKALEEAAAALESASEAGEELDSPDESAEKKTDELDATTAPTPEPPVQETTTEEETTETEDVVPELTLPTPEEQVKSAPTTEDEQHTVENQIEDFLKNNAVEVEGTETDNIEKKDLILPSDDPTPVTPVPEPATSAPEVSEPSTTETVTEDTSNNVIKTRSMATENAAPEQAAPATPDVVAAPEPATQADEKLESADYPESGVAGKKVIHPINDVFQKPDLNALLEKEKEKEEVANILGSAGVTPPPAQPPAPGQQAHPEGQDPNLIAL